MVQFSYSSTHYTNWAYANASAGPSAKWHGQALLHSFPLLNLGALSSVTSFQNSSEDTESTKGTSNGSIRVVAMVKKKPPKTEYFEIISLENHCPGIGGITEENT